MQAWINYFINDIRSFPYIFKTIIIFRRKSALPKYDPPYLKRPMIPGKGYSHPNSPHPSQHMPPEHTEVGENNKMINFTPTPTYRSVE